MNFQIDGVTFSSKFDSGNLACVEKVESVDPLCVEYQLEYNLWTSPDAAGTANENGNRTWFHFSVKGAVIGKKVKFNVNNLNKQTKLFMQGMAPVYKVVPSKKCTWERVRDRPSYETVDGEFNMSFTHRFDDTNRCSATYFAYCYPFSYEENKTFLDQLEAKYNMHEDIYFHRDTLCLTNNGLAVDLLTVTSTKDLQEAREPTLPKLFTPHKLRAHKFINKKVYFLTSRVHPGETPSSFVFSGFLKFILREDDERARALRNTFVFKMVPMLNPDGVQLGHYRTDAAGVNLNRMYTKPDFLLHPSIFAVKGLMSYYHEPKCLQKKNLKRKTKSLPDMHKPVCSVGKSNRQIRRKSDGVRCKRTVVKTFKSADSLSTAIKNRIAIYVDLHAHASRRGCFMYGNNFKDETSAVECMLYPKLLSLNSPNFDFAACNFTEKNMRHRDKRDGTTKEGSGRVAMFKSLGLIHSYTLECNYNSGLSTNAIARGGGRATPPPPPTFPPRYNISHFEEIGQSLAVAALDLYEINPWSRLPNSDLRSLSRARDWLSKHCRANQPKKRVNSSNKNLIMSKDLPLKSKDLPLKSKDLPLKSKDLSLKSKDLLLKSKDLSLKSKDLPLKSKDLSLKSKDLPLKSKDLPLKSKDLPLKSKDLPLKSKDLPLKSKDLSLKSKDLPLKSKDLPLKSKDLPLKSKDLPLKSKDLPLKSKDLPLKSKDLPLKSKNSLQKSREPLNIIRREVKQNTKKISIEQSTCDIIKYIRRKSSISSVKYNKLTFPASNDSRVKRNDVAVKKT